MLESYAARAEHFKVQRKCNTNRLAEALSNEVSELMKHRICSLQNVSDSIATKIVSEAKAANEKFSQVLPMIDENTEQMKEAERMNDELRVCTSELERRKTYKTHLEERLIQVSHNLLTLQAQVEERDRGHEAKLSKVSAQRNMYQDFLSFRFVRTSSDKIMLIFTQISQAQPEKEYIVQLQVDDRYNFISSSPQLNGIEQLMQQLNQTDNLRSFLVKVRKQFQAVHDVQANVYDKYL